MGGGPTFYIQEMDLLSLTTCLTLLVIATIGIEVTMEKLHECCKGKAKEKILHKAIAELMILGIISFVTVNVIQIDVACESPLIDMVLAEFEMAHVWLFFVGIMYILNTIIFVITLDWVKTSWDLCDAMHTVDIQSKYLIDGDPKDIKSPLDWNWNTEERRSSCMYQIAGPGNGKFSRAEFKVLKLYFIQQHWGILKQELGEKNVHQFDYAQYMRTVVTEEIVELLEVTPVTWGVFVVFLWVVYGVWSGVLDNRYDNGLTLVSVMLAWALFGLVLLLVVESHRGMQRLHAQVAECFNVTTESNALEETFKKLSEKWLFHGGKMPKRRASTFSGLGNADHFAIADDLGEKHKSVEMTATKETPRTSKEISVTVSEKENNDDVEKGVSSIGSPRRSASDTSQKIKNKKTLKSQATQRFKNFVKAEGKTLSGLTRISPKTMSSLSGLIMFFQCFMIGLLFLVNLPEAVNGTEHFGSLSPTYMKQYLESINTTSSALSSSTASSDASSSSASGRMLLGASSSAASSSATSLANPYVCYKKTITGGLCSGEGETRRRRLSRRIEQRKIDRRNLGGGGDPNPCPDMNVPHWGYCRDYAPDFQRRDLDLRWSYNVEYIGAAPFTSSGQKYICTVYANGYAWFCILLALIPQLLISFKLQPMLVKNYCYMAAITMGAEGKEEKEEDGAKHHQEGHGHDGHDEHGHHGGHFDDAEFSHILGMVFDKMHEDETNAKMFRDQINGALRKRALNRADDGDDQYWNGKHCTLEMYNVEMDILYDQLDSGSGADAGDGLLSYTELKTGLNKLFRESGAQRMTNQKFKRLIRILDKDRGGVIDSDEFHEFLHDDKYEWPKPKPRNDSVDSIIDDNTLITPKIQRNSIQHEVLSASRKQLENSK